MTSNFDFKIEYLDDSLDDVDDKDMEKRKEKVIEIPYLIVRYCACRFCLGDMVERIIKSKYDKDEVKIKGIINNLDHVYLRWLITGKERVLFMQCSHDKQLQKNCYYLRGKARIYLGSPIKSNINDYENVRILIRLTDRVKRKLIERHSQDAFFL
ncbi:MAG: hypothetical protein WD512_18425 [Candidatus Paceibacterota bacterium]